MCSPSPTGTVVVEGLQKSVRFKEVLPAWWAAYVAARARWSFGPLRCVAGEPFCQGLGADDGVSYSEVSTVETPHPAQLISSIKHRVKAALRWRAYYWFSYVKIGHENSVTHRRSYMSWTEEISLQRDRYWGARWKPRHTPRRVTCPEKART